MANTEPGEPLAPEHQDRSHERGSKENSTGEIEKRLIFSRNKFTQSPALGFAGGLVLGASAILASNAIRDERDTPSTIPTNNSETPPTPSSQEKQEEIAQLANNYEQSLFYILSNINKKDPRDPNKNLISAETIIYAKKIILWLYPDLKREFADISENNFDFATQLAITSDLRIIRGTKDGVRFNIDVKTRKVTNEDKKTGKPAPKEKSTEELNAELTSINSNIANLYVPSWEPDPYETKREALQKRKNEIIRILKSRNEYDVY